MTKFTLYTFFIIFTFSSMNFIANASPPGEELYEVDFKIDNSDTEKHANANIKAIWPKNNGKTEIAICWEKSAKGFSIEKKWVREAIAKSWEKFSKLSFTAWTECPDEETRSTALIRIGHSDGKFGDRNTEAPHTYGLGSELNNVKNGMILNFIFNNWGKDECFEVKEDCIKEIAVHEFGHAIGLMHEQDRFDARNDKECMKYLKKNKYQYRVLGTPVGPYDPFSRMNYCSLFRRIIDTNMEAISGGDISAVQQYYEAP